MNTQSQINAANRANAYEQLTSCDEAERWRMSRQFATWPAQLLSLAIQRRNGARNILDIGAGLGAAVSHVKAHASTAHYIAVDSVASRVSFIAQEATRLSLPATVLHDTAESLESIPDGSIDIAIASFLLTHCHSVHQVLSTIARKLAPGGLLVISDVDYFGAISTRCHSLGQLLELIRGSLSHGDLGSRFEDIVRSAGMSPLRGEEISHQQRFGGMEIQTMALDFVANFKEETPRQLLQSIGSGAELHWSRVQTILQKPAAHGWFACSGASL